MLTTSSLMLRAFLEAAAKLTGDHLEQRTTPEVLGFDTTSMPVDLEHVPTIRDASSVTVLTAHVSDVAGGFGVAKQAVARWRRWLEQGKVPAELVRQLPDPTDLGGSSFLLALLERYSRAPYHRIGSRRAGNIRNHPTTLRTAHGNGGNLGNGWALDCGHKETLTDELIRVGRASFADAVADVVEAGGSCVVVPHRVWAADRRVDTSAAVWLHIVKATVLELQRVGVPVRIGYNTSAGGGLPIPRSWDPDALYDDRGRVIAA
jgi:hypothetical protein